MEYDSGEEAALPSGAALLDAADDDDRVVITTQHAQVVEDDTTDLSNAGEDTQDILRAAGVELDSNTGQEDEDSTRYRTPYRQLGVKGSTAAPSRRKQAHRAAPSRGVLSSKQAGSAASSKPGKPRSKAARGGKEGSKGPHRQITPPPSAQPLFTQVTVIGSSPLIKDATQRRSKRSRAALEEPSTQASTQARKRASPQPKIPEFGVEIAWENVLDLVQYNNEVGKKANTVEVIKIYSRSRDGPIIDTLPSTGQSTTDAGAEPPPKKGSKKDKEKPQGKTATTRLHGAQQDRQELTESLMEH
ncbi:hypothetical protein H2201_004054 [Coniosporium apollinis]|uniref:Uncharacterized protein n=1 Tax=Coniosporium apollinis TaxID=61459 RepID=A0ABQ9NU65_9PEZI|nr:hypothetical protein H2201_004054 [Coniosporium apollinis]